MSNEFESLERLATLFERGVLSKDEFDQAKARILQGINRDEAKPRQSFSIPALTPKARNILLLTIAALVGVGLALAVWRDLPEAPGTSAKRELGSERKRISIGFTNLSDCKPGQQLETLLADLRGATSSGDTDAEASELSQGRQPEGIRVVQSNGLTIAARPIRGNWGDVAVNEVRRLSWPGGSGLQLVTSSSLSALRALVEEQGLLIGEKLYSSQTGKRIAFIEPLAAGASFTCMWPIARRVDDRMPTDKEEQI